jgi:hypothetical protein
MPCGQDPGNLGTGVSLGLTLSLPGAGAACGSTTINREPSVPMILPMIASEVRVSHTCLTSVLSKKKRRFQV